MIWTKKDFDDFKKLEMSEYVVDQIRNVKIVNGTLVKPNKISPCHIGCLIYSYGWKHMYENIYS